MNNLSHALVCAVTAATLLSCGEPPPTPNLLGHPVKKAERVILDDVIDSKDIRQIFDALNEDGQLEGLAPWVRDSSDAELNSIGKIITTYIYQPAQDSNGLVSVLNDRISRRAFSNARNSSREFARHADNRALSDLIDTVLHSKRFVDIVERDIGFLSPALDESLDDLHQEFQKAWNAPDPECAPPLPMDVASMQSVRDASNFLSTPGLKNRFVKLCDSLSDSWPVVGLLQSIRQVNSRHGGHAFDGMGAGISKMIREPRTPGGDITQFDTLMELVKTLEGPSNGLFTAIQEKVEKNPDMLREFGTILQPNLPTQLRLGPYIPFLPNTTTALLVAQLESPTPPLSRTDWLALPAKTTVESQNAYFQFFTATRTAHENLIGPAHELGTDDYLVYNLPLFLNSFVLSNWMTHAVSENKAALGALTDPGFTQKWLDTKISTTDYNWALVELDPIGNPLPTFTAARLTELADFGLTDFSDALAAVPATGLGKFRYVIPAMRDVTVREALRKAMEAIDTTRGYADGSAVVRAVMASLTRRGAGGKSLLENLETPDLLLSTHRKLSSLDLGTWKQVRGMLFDGANVDAWNDDTRKSLLNLFESKPAAVERVKRILDSIGVLKDLDTSGKNSVSAFEAYLEIVGDSGPREWQALTDGWLFIADSGLFSMKKGASGLLEPRYATAHAWLSTGNTAGLLRLASELQPSRYRPIADFVHDVIRLRDGVKGSELHWDFFQEIVNASPNGVEALLDGARGGSLSSVREKLTLGERDWIVRFVQAGAFRDLWKVVSPRLGKGAPGKWLTELRRFQSDGSLRSVFRLMGLVKNDRINAIAKMLQEWEKSGELTAFLDTLESFLTTAGPQPTH